MKAKLYITTAIIAALALGFIVGRYGLPGNSLIATEDIDHRLSSSSYKFISPLLECVPNRYYITGPIRELERELRDYVHAYEERGEREGHIGHISIYYRDLTNGPWFGIHEEEEFLPASLAKVPLMISILKFAERDLSLLDKKLEFKPSQRDLFQHYVPEAQLTQGKSYSVQELIRQMIIYSDNDALDTLFYAPFIDTSIYDDIYRDFGIEAPQSAEATINVKTYASFFRILYNATYLPPLLSEFALETLSKTIFTAGLRAGVPDSVPIAHKFGERTNRESGERQLHDCGIVYAPGRPYVLCVLTRGDDFGELSAIIADVSEKVYKSVTSAR